LGHAEKDKENLRTCRQAGRYPTLNKECPMMKESRSLLLGRVRNMTLPAPYFLPMNKMKL
jgi:hypothetical protein